MDPEFWRSKRVLITGHTGFKGSWLALWLQRLGAEVTGFALAPPTTPSLFEAAGVAAGMTSFVGDVRDLAALVRVVREFRPEVVLHLAAQSLVRASYESPVETYATNVMGTVHVLEAARQVSGVRVVVNVTTDKCYANQEWIWGYRENEPMGGRDPYSSSKGCAELVTAAYRDSFFAPSSAGDYGVSLASARAGNVIGGGDWARDRLVPDVITAVAAGRPVLIRNPDAVRPWQHVLDPLAGYLRLAARLWTDPATTVGAWNFGPDADGARPVAWVVDAIVAGWGEGARWERDTRLQPHEANFLKLDSTKARSLLGWRPRLDTADAVEWVVSWHKAYERHQPARELVLADIARYEALR
jgi:CDP-glucose 4,6-dehydratase